MPVTFVSDHTAILGTSSWAPETPNAPTILTYSFAEEPSGPTLLLPTSEGFQPFTACLLYTSPSPRDS